MNANDIAGIAAGLGGIATIVAICLANVMVEARKLARA